MPDIHVATALTLACLAAWIWVHQQAKSRRYPPGPPRLPLFGVRDMPEVDVAKTYFAWAKQFGE